MTQKYRKRSSWRGMAIAALSVTAVNLLLLDWLTRHGWLGGSAFPKPLGMRLVAYGALNLLFVITPLAMYERVCHRSERWALAAYLCVVAAFCLVSVPVLHGFLTRGVFVFGGDYSVTVDVTWGAAQYLIALAIYRCIVKTPSTITAR